VALSELGLPSTRRHQDAWGAFALPREASSL